MMSFVGPIKVGRHGWNHHKWVGGGFPNPPYGIFGARSSLLFKLWLSYVILSSTTLRSVMASITVNDFGLHRVASVEVDVEGLIAQVKHLEKHTFSKNEAMDFDTELRKQNTELLVVLAPMDAGGPIRGAALAAYMLHARVHGVALLHKICVADVYQRRGLARSMIIRLISNLELQGCQKVQLWVDFLRPPAVGLYTALGFKKGDRAKDYYGRDRHGLQMTYDMNNIW